MGLTALSMDEREKRRGGMSREHACVCKRERDKGKERDVERREKQWEAEQESGSSPHLASLKVQ